jgi:lipoprotein-anchoring transpeptidase ErfK/SrfK
MKALALRNFVLLVASMALAACSGSIPAEKIGSSGALPGYGEIREGHIVIPAIDAEFLAEPNRRTSVPYFGSEPPGTIIVDPHAKFLYFVEPSGSAMRYPIAVGREGRGISGQATIARKAEWPSWTPTANMIRRDPELYGPFARGIPGGKANPLGARALYLYRGGRDTYYRIHGTNDPSTIGNAGSAGCIRMFNQDVIDLYERVPIGAKVVIRTYEQSLAAEGFEMANRGGEITPKPVDAAQVYALVAEEERRKAEYEAMN